MAGTEEMQGTLISMLSIKKTSLYHLWSIFIDQASSNQCSPLVYSMSQRSTAKSTVMAPLCLLSVIKVLFERIDMDIRRDHLVLQSQWTPRYNTHKLSLSATSQRTAPWRHCVISWVWIPEKDMMLFSVKITGLTLEHMV